MYAFNSDYMEGAHPLILEKLAAINLEKNAGYGLDPYCAQAREKIRSACGCPGADVHFLVGGTQTNATVIDAVLASYQGVVAADSGHINTHEAGAIELSGHKVLTVPQVDGKVTAAHLEAVFERYRADEAREHTVMPGMVYLSHPTEYGTLYTHAELSAISRICRRYGAPLYVDGARLGYALAADDTDVTLSDLAELCDLFYIGGTKVGALLGEALVVPNPARLPHFFSVMKQHGALLAKGWLLGAQFTTLFTENLYLRIARNAVEQAARIRRALRERGYPLVFENPTNQIFVQLDNETLARLEPQVGLGIWERADDAHTVVRLVTSWATSPEDVDGLIALL